MHTDLRTLFEVGSVEVNTPPTLLKRGRELGQILSQEYDRMPTATWKVI